MTQANQRTIGYIGLGAMGGGMARNLLRAGYHVIGYDIRPEAMQRHIAEGGEAASSVSDVVARADQVHLSLVSHVNISVARETLISEARRGQIFVDHSTIPAPHARELHDAFGERGARYLEAPVSGWYTGAEAGALSMYVGGDADLYEQVKAQIDVMAAPEKVVFAPGKGMGQVMKVVQQLQDRLADVARMEVMSFGVRAGLTPEQIMDILRTKNAAENYRTLYERVRDGDREKLGFLFAEWPYYLEEADAKGMAMPMLRAAYEHCRQGPFVLTDEQGRAMPCVWDELLKPVKTASSEAENSMASATE